MTVTNDLEIAKEIATKLRERIGPQLTEIIFFGSRAKGIPKPYSDFDLLIVLKRRDNKKIDSIYDETTKLEIEHEIDISLKVYSEEDYKRKMDLGTPFMRSVHQSGIPV